MGFFEAVAEAVEGREQGPAFLGSASVRGWGETIERARRMAAGFAGLGIDSGDRIAILAPNSELYVEAYLACVIAGAVLVPMNTRWSLAEIGHAVQDSGPKLCIASRDHWANASAVAGNGQLRLLRDVDGDSAGASPPSLDQLAASSPLAAPRPSPDGLFGIFYTGGTTGRPKGVAITHEGILSNARAVRALGMFPDGCSTLHVAPVFHLAAAMAVVATSIAGGAHVCQATFDVEAVQTIVRAVAVTDALMVPTMIDMILDHDGVDPEAFSSLQRLVYGASPMSRHTLARLRGVFPELKLFQAYGMTEASCAATILGPEGHVGEESLAQRGSVGRAIPGTDVRIRASDGSTARAGELGEIAVRGPGVMRCYWNNDGLTRETIADGWLRTGDGGWMDEDGNLFIADRLKDMIVTGGENVYSIEVEGALATHPAVRQCAIVGMPDPQWGERVHAVVFLRAGMKADEAELVAHCRTIISGYKCPRGFTFVDHPLPASATGKLLKGDIRALVTRT